MAAVEAQKLSDSEINEAAQYLWQACESARESDRLSSRFQELSIADAYRIQQAGMRLREARGARLLGWKMGLTSEAKRQQMSLDSAIFGYLLDEGLKSGAQMSLSGLIHPKVEAEIGFRLKKPLKGKVSLAEARDAVGGVCAALEIIDSRYVGFKYFSLPDVIADNCSAAQFFWGPEIVLPPTLDLAQLNMKLSINGVCDGAVLASEISGDPLLSLVQLAQMLEPWGLEIPANAIVLAGAATVATALSAGMTVQLEIDQIPSLSFQVD